MASVSSDSIGGGSLVHASSIPPTPPQRLARAADQREACQTVLYLGYGSNMSAQVFLHDRGIRPLSQINVSVPSLRLTMDLAGVPYLEPCFANVGFRNESHKVLQDKPNMAGEWDGRLMGVVYEVTLDDFRTIIATEGAGVSYKEITVSCIPMEPDVSGPFLAQTLYAPQPVDDMTDWTMARRLRLRLTSGYRSEKPRRGQPSARYLGLVQAGAREHRLPESYQKHLASLQPYMMTRLRQRVGQILLLLLWGPLLVVAFMLAPEVADKTGRLPPRLARAVAFIWSLMWVTYDYVFEPIFGSGERTEDIAGAYQ